MKLKICFFLFALVTCCGISTWAFPADFYRKSGEIYDSWNLCRTRPQGIDGYFQVTREGFRPVITYESLGRNADLAWQLGEKFKERYPEPLQRAEAIYRLARDRIRYTQDIDQFGYPEFAQNADELASSMEKGKALGDCEDYAVFLSVLYQAAGYRSAIVLIPGHAAALIYLPQYKKGNVYLQVKEESGWIWAEATGRRNRLGWCPSKAFKDKVWAYEIKEAGEITFLPQKGGELVHLRQRGFGLKIPYFSLIFLFMWILPALIRILRRII